MVIYNPTILISHYTTTLLYVITDYRSLKNISNEQNDQEKLVISVFVIGVLRKTVRSEETGVGSYL